MKKYFYSFFIFLSCLFIQTHVYCENSSHTRVQLFSEVSEIHPAQPFWIAIQFEMDPHWHIYWKNPAESGMPTQIKWSLPDGFTVRELLWPAPKKISISGIHSYGYENKAVLLAQIVPPKHLDSKHFKISAHIQWLECAEICVPGNSNPELLLPISFTPQALPLQFQELFNSARSQIPLDLQDISFALHDSFLDPCLHKDLCQ